MVLVLGLVFLALAVQRMELALEQQVVVVEHRNQDCPYHRNMLEELILVLESMEKAMTVEIRNQEGLYLLDMTEGLTIVLASMQLVEVVLLL